MTVGYRKLHVIEVMDWYDGLVLGVVRIDGVTDLLLASMLALDVTSSRRVFVLMRLDEAQLSQIRTHAKGDWAALQQYVGGLAHGLTGDVTIVQTNGKNEVVGELVMRADDVRDEIPSDVEVAVDAKRQRWFHVFRLQG